MNKYCAFKNCHTPIQNNKLMCSMHWSHVSTLTQLAVYKTAKAYQKIDPRTATKDNFFEVKNDYYASVRRACKDVAISLGLIDESKS